MLEIGTRLVSALRRSMVFPSNHSASTVGAKNGDLKDTKLYDLLIALLTSNIDLSLVEDVCIGNVLAVGQDYIARSAVLAARLFPVSTTTTIANRFCTSGLLAAQNIANQIIAGSIDTDLAIDAESMSMPDDGAPVMGEKITGHPVAEFRVAREAIDQFAATYFQRAEKVQKEKWVDDEIVPINVQVKDANEVSREVALDRDDGKITDGASAVLPMKRSRAQKLGQPIVGKFYGATVVGLNPKIGIGPSLAMPKILSKCGLHKDDIDVFVITEAFASMGVYCIEHLGLDPSKVNPRGGGVLEMELRRYLNQSRSESLLVSKGIEMWCFLSPVV
ncbi:3-ketoacyl-CoA thiolase B [Calycina marina]|uniref:3-ketoacyl-CoA thiolase B n=1 Tax=Calycina marina TaxID=1763456 RepID=A0A9P7Z7Z8_9HELO|nr:3-ketoacyl-CoA thiolase B [Calycina marina]